MPGDEVLLELGGVGKNYAGPGDQGSLPILRDIDLRVPAGASLAIVGPSGSGKTTFLNLVGALDRPDRGRVVLNGQDLARLNDTELSRVRCHSIGFIFQSHHLLPHLTVLENVLVPTLADDAARNRQSGPDRAVRLLRRVGLESRLHHRPGQLSGGERQRTAVVRALINQPALLLADEPTGALDQASARELGRLLRELNQEEGVTLMVVTHSLELAREMDAIYELVGGQLRVFTA